MSASSIHRVAPDELTVASLHDIIRLRVDVFVVEQDCAYAELDGRDLAPSTVHWWIGQPVAALERTQPQVATPIESYIRVIDHEPTEAEPATRQLGRVVTNPDARGHGHAATLINAVLADEPGPMMCEAQSYLREWYEGLGFVVTGEEFVEDGIPHLPMRANNSS